MKPNIFYIWVQGLDEMPLHLRENYENCKLLNGDCNVVLLDDGDLRKACYQYSEKCGWVYDIILKDKHPVSKSDLGRYVVLYLYGGVYIDCDTIVIKPLKSLVDMYKGKFAIMGLDNMFNSFLPKGNTINNCFMICNKGNEYIRMFIDEILVNMEENKNLNGSSFVYSTTSTVMFPDFIFKNYELLDTSRVKNCGVYDTCTVDKNTMVIHMSEISWFGKKNKILHFLRKFWYIWVLMIAFLFWKRKEMVEYISKKIR